MKDKIIKALAKVTGINASEIRLEVPEREEFGDYSSNVAMATFENAKLQITNAKWKNPRELALQIVAEINNSELIINNYLEKVEIAGPGFINFHLSKQALFDVLVSIKDQKDMFGENGSKKNKKVVIEYTDPNPFKELHIGHLISNVTGEAFCRLQEACGATLWRADYYGDVGVHVAKSIWGIRRKMQEDKVSLKDLAKKDLTTRINFMGQGYAMGSRAFEEDETAKEEIGRLNTVLYIVAQRMWAKKGKKSEINYDPTGKFKEPEITAVTDLYLEGRMWSLEYFETLYTRLGTKFDGYYPESVVGEVGYKLVKDNIGKVFEESEGAVIFKGEKFGLHTRVFINKHNLPTYEAKELGLAPTKYEDFKYDESVIVVGKEIKEYFQVLVKALTEINPKLGSVTKPICTGMVNLTEGKMSSRKGNVVTVSGLLDSLKVLIVKRMVKHEYSDTEKEDISEMVAVGALKYAFLKQGVGQDFIFDLEKSLSLDGNSGPYIQYTYARTQSVARKAGITNSKLQITNDNSEFRIQNLELKNEEVSLLRSLNHFPEVVEEAASNFAPNLLCNYVYDLAQKFNGFYARHKIIDINNERGKSEALRSNKHSILGGDLQPTTDNLQQVRSFRVALTSATGQVLKNGLNILGIQAPERM